MNPSSATTPSAYAGRLIAAASGLALAAAFPKLQWTWLLIWALAPLVVVLGRARPAEAFRLGMLAGLAHHLALLYWLAPTMRTYGYLPWYLAVAVLFLMSAVLALFWAAAAWALVRVGRGPVAAAVWFPVLWVAAEYLRSFLFTGFPWGLLGHSLYRQTEIIQAADLAGVYLLSFAIAAVNADMALGILHFSRQGWRQRPIKRRTLVTIAACAVLLVGGLKVYGDRRLAEIDRLQAAAGRVKVAALQGNIPQSDKWDEAYKQRTIEIYARLTQKAAAAGAQLVVWPETAAPFYFGLEAAPTRRVLAAVRDSQTAALVGSPAVEQDGGEAAFFNRAWLLGPDGALLGAYDKAHLVPFGEYTPYKQYLPFLGKMVAQVGDFRPGKRGRTLDWAGRPLGVLICYEVIFPPLARAHVLNGARLLVNITNDAWYGRTSGPYQHFSMTVFRAVETRRALVRAANTGISGFVDAAGRMQATTGLFEEAVTAAELPLLDIQTPYTRWGDVFAKACLAASVAGIIGSAVRRRRPGGGRRPPPAA